MDLDPRTLCLGDLSDLSRGDLDGDLDPRMLSAGDLDRFVFGRFNLGELTLRALANGDDVFLFDELSL